MQTNRTIIAVCLTMMLGCAPASAGVIGVVAPKSGPFASLGQQILTGARAAVTKTGDTLVEIDESCDEAGGATAARALQAAKAQMAIGFLCAETLTTALPILKAGPIPAITLSVRSSILMEDAQRNGWPFFRMAPSEKAEAEALAQALLQKWKAEPIAFIDDGTIYGRDLVGAVRQHLEPLGIKPAFTDTLRPGQEQQIALVRRLAKTGATHAIIGAERNDIAIILRDAQAENISLTVIGGDAMRAANRPIPLRDGALAVTLPDYASLPTATAATIAIRNGRTNADGYSLPAYAAVEIAHQVLAAGTPVLNALTTATFNTAIGPIGFSADHELRQTPYALMQWRADTFVPDHPVTE